MSENNSRLAGGKETMNPEAITTSGQATGLLNRRPQVRILPGALDSHLMSQSNLHEEVRSLVAHQLQMYGIRMPLSSVLWGVDTTISQLSRFYCDDVAPTPSHLAS